MLPRWAIVLGGMLALGGMLSGLVPFRWQGAYWTAVIAAAAVSALLSRERAAGGGENPWVRKGEFLCDSCKYNHPDHCSRPERPNATRCPDHRARG
jgi:hypothetical protein